MDWLVLRSKDQMSMLQQDHQCCRKPQ